MESQLQNPEFRIIPENCHPCYVSFYTRMFVYGPLEGCSSSGEE